VSVSERRFRNAAEGEAAVQIMYLPFFVITLAYGALHLGRGAWRGDSHELASGFPSRVMTAFLLLNMLVEVPATWFRSTLLIASAGWCALEIVLSRVFGK
jgi:hypothetical protein